MENIVLAIVALESLRDFNFMTNQHKLMGETKHLRIKISIY